VPTRPADAFCSIYFDSSRSSSAATAVSLSLSLESLALRQQLDVYTRTLAPTPTARNRMPHERLSVALSELP
jgi:hypothetical protein